MFVLLNKLYCSHNLAIRITLYTQLMLLANLYTSIIIMQVTLKDKINILADFANTIKSQNF